MNRLRASTLGAVLALAVLTAGAGPARAVRVSAGSGSGLAGQTVDIDISTTSLTGLNVFSLQFDLSYYNLAITPVTVVDPAGTLAGNAGWSAPAYYVTNSGGTGTIHVSAAGSAALTGAGSMLRVRFLINPALLNGGSSGLNLANTIFNEGSPADTTSNGSFSIGVTPQIAVSPPSGEIVRGQTLQFSATGSVTLPVNWSTSDNSVATIDGSGLLTGVGPGAVTVTATDAALHTATTSGTVLVRGMGLTAGTAAVVAGQNATIPITTTSLTGLGIRSGQFTLTWNTTIATRVSVTTPAGTLLNGWGPLAVGPALNGCTVDFVGSSDLAGSGVLCYVNFATSTGSPGGTSMALSNVTFNETLVAKTTNGSLNVQALPTLGLSPGAVTLLAGQTQQYTVSGSPTLPLTWSVADPTIATVSATGLLTAVKGGDTQVQVQDAVGARGYANVSVYDFTATIGNVVGAPGSTVKVPITADRLVGGLGIWSMQFDVHWSANVLSGGSASTSGLWSLWGPPASHFDNALVKLTCAGAGSTTMANNGTQLGAVLLQISPSASPGTNAALSLQNLVFNEGFPRALLGNGLLQVHSTTDVPPGGLPAEFGLGLAEPNPGRDAVRIPFALPADANGASVRLGIYDLDGRRVKLLVDGVPGAGPHEVFWNVLDDAGRPQRPGLYFARLELGMRVATRKLTIVR